MSLTHTSRSLTRSLIGIGGLLALAACGGGGGGGSTATPTPTPTTYTIGGTTSGLAGSGLVLQNNAAGNLTVTSSSFTFATAVASGGAYAVTVLTQPSTPTQTCTVSNGTGTATANVTNIAVACTTASFAVSGTVSGLSGSIVLQNNGGGNITVSANGTFNFPAQLSGSAYAITVQSHPTGPAQSCTVTNGSGTIGAAAVSNVAIVCANTAFTVGGTVSGLAGTGLVLHEASNQNVTVSANGSFTFATPLSSGSTYTVTVQTQPTGPSQTCIVSSGTGTVAAANITSVVVSCSVNSFTVGGTVSGLATSGSVVLQNNLGDNLTVSANGAFAFTTPVSSGATYAVTRLTNPTVPAGTPAGQTCTVGSGSGTVAGANVTNVTVACVNNDTAAPTVSARTPVPTIVGLPLTTIVTATFSEALDPATLTVSTFTVTGPGGPVSGTVTLTTGNTRAVFTPTSALSFDSEYTATLTTAIKDVAGNAISSTSWKFNTGARISIAGLHGCARMTDGRVKCWGYNLHGQLGIDNIVNHGDGSGLMGNGTTGANGDGLLPVNLGAGRTAVAVAVGEWHSCAILDNGQVKCWGRNDHGQLGLGFVSATVGGNAGDMANFILPVNLGAGRTALEIAAGEYDTCARLDNGTVKCWGGNVFGQLGQGNTFELGVAPGDIAAAPPIALGTGRTAVQISAGLRHVCAILDDATVKCWGRNDHGNLGLGDPNHRGDGPGEMGDSLPAANLGTGRTALEVRASAGHTCARLDNNAVRCWGNNGWGQAGTNAGNDAPSNRAVCEVKVAGLLGHSCIGDEPGEMGDNLANAIPAGNAIAIGISDRSTCAFLTGNTIKCWGSNEVGQLGLGDFAEPKYTIGDSPGEMAALAAPALKPGKTIMGMAVGGFFICVHNTDGTVQCWGDNEHGELGLGTDSTNNPASNIGDAPGEMGAALVDLDLGT